MWVDVSFDNPLTLGELRELVNNEKLSKFPDNIQINMCIDKCKNNVMDEIGEFSAPVLSVTGDKNEVKFYNYI